MHLFACGPSPQKVVEQVTVAAAPDAVWAMVSDVANMQRWHPSVLATKVNKIIDADGNETVYRTLTLADGGQLEERIRPMLPNTKKVGVVIEKGSWAVSSYSDALTVKPGLSAGTSIVTWTGRFNNKANLLVAPKGQDNEAAIADVTQFFVTGLSGLKQLFLAQSSM